MKLFLAVMLSTALAISPFSDESTFLPNVSEEYTEDAEQGSVVLRADKIVIKWRIYNGKNQYRRFNATKNQWVDPYWIDA